MAGRISGNIVKDGLVFYLDAANTKSYVSGSTIWNDLSRSQTNGTLINGPTFNPANGGSIVLDQVNDYISLSKLTITTSLTFNVFIKISSILGVNQGFWRDGVSSGGSSFNILQATTNLPWVRWNGVNILQPLSGYSVPSNTWVYLTYVVQNGGPNVYFYVNGDLKHSNTHSSTITSIDIYNIGYQLAIGQKVPGDYSILSFYNRALTAQEVLQNYNATKSRYGL